MPPHPLGGGQTPPPLERNQRQLEGNREMKRNTTIDKWEELERLVRRHARVIETLPDGTIRTCDAIDGCDAHYSDTVEDAIEWERGYN